MLRILECRREGKNLFSRAARDLIADSVFCAENVSVVPADEDIVREDRGFEVCDFRFPVGCGFIHVGGDHVDV